MTSPLLRQCGATCLLVILALLGTGCGESSPLAPEYTAYRNLMSSEGLDIEVPPDPRLRATVTRAAEVEARALGQRVRWVEPGGAARGAARMIVGTPDTVGVPAILERLGVTVGPQGFQLRGAPPELWADALVATVGDPQRPGHPVTLVCAPDSAGLAGLEPFLRSVRPAWRAGLRAYRGGDLLLEARLSQAGELEHIELLTELRAELRSGAEFDDDGLVIRVAPQTPERELLSWRRANVAARRSVAAFFGSASPEPLAAQTYAHPEDLRRLTRVADLSTLNPSTGAVHALVAPGQPHDGGFGVARAQALSTGGWPARDWMLDGIAADAVPTWWGVPKGSWIAFLAEGDSLPSLEVLVDPLAQVSPHMLVPLRGVLFDLLVKRLGRDEVRLLWRGELELILDDELTAAFLDTLATRRERRAESLRDTRAERLATSLHRGERRLGANLLAPPDAGYGRGFGTRACDRSLDDLAAVGANSVALVFRGAVEAGPERFALGRRSGDISFLVSDLELVATSRAARARGLATMFKPELLARASGIRIGDKAAESPEEAARFFADSRRCLVHVALVAELVEADLLCFGTELTHAAPTLNPESPEFMQANQEPWNDLIAALRGSFRGALTYAADWRGEVGEIEFWSQLDFVGVNMFPALGIGEDRERPDDGGAERHMLADLRDLVAGADEHHMPALICEVGFPSTSEAWRQPEAARGEPDLAEQARLYRVLQQVLLEQDPTRDILEGLYLWNWSTDPDAGRVLDHSFTPQNRPALEYATQLFESF